MILMVYSSDILREIVLPNTDNTDFNILIDSGSYKTNKSFYINLEVINRRWRITENKNIYKLILNKQKYDKIELTNGSIITVKTIADDVLKFIVIDCESSLISYEKYLIDRSARVTIGNSDGSLIRYGFMGLVSKNHCIITYDRGNLYLHDLSTNGTFVNNKRVYSTVRLNFGDTVDIFGLKIICFDNIIAVGSHINSFTVADSLDKYEFSVDYSDKSDTFSISQEHYFNRSPRLFSEISYEEVVIEPPSVPQFSKKRPLLYVIGPSFTMAIPMLLGCGLAIFSTMMSGSYASAFMFTGIITSVGSAFFGALWAFMNIRETKKREAEDEAERFNIYANYLIEIAEYIKSKYRQNYEALHSMYPSSDRCVRYNEQCPELWCRNYSHEDFLFCRLGTGDVDFQVKIKIPKEKFSVTYDSLKDKPSIINDNYKVLRGVPVGADLRKSNLFGIAGGRFKKGVRDVVNNIIVQLASNICYTDLKIAFCFNKSDIKNKHQWDYIRWLPHVWSEDRQIRYFATDKQECADVFFELANILRVRADNQSSYGSRNVAYKPYYILFVSDISLLEGELLAKYVFDKNNNIGLTTFIMTDFYQNLPNVCENIIQNDNEFCGIYNVMNRGGYSASICFDKVPESSLSEFSENLSGVSVRELEDDSSIVSSLDFFEMYGVHSLEDFNILEQWRKNRTFNSMKALVGKKAGGADCYLDIHEKYHGPHGLIAGTTGSGKSELIQTLILSLAINYSPDDISFFIIDFKGGGMANLFSNLPHMAGQISNLSGNQVRRAMISIKSENLRRQRLFNEYGVNNINNYTRLYKSGETALPIPHLVIIIDEFAELKKEEPDFMRELISVAQVGRSLGVHLLLATQKPNGTVDDNIWSNAKFRLCLRVQDKQDSNDMLHKPDAAYITQAGRCYLQVGNDEIYELFQSGWSGAAYDNSESAKQEIATMITPTGKTAIIGSHTKMKRKEKEKLRWYSFLYNQAVRIKSGNSEDNNGINQSNDEDVAVRIIEAAQNHNYNIGMSNSEINSVKNFIKLMPSEKISVAEGINKVIEKATLKNVRLPELKEKTQLEAIVEYIAKIAHDNNIDYKTRLWMPLLKKKINLASLLDKNILFDKNGWKNFDKWSLDAVVGLYDDPQNQAQLPLSIDFDNGGHLAICGSVVTGKSTFIQTLIFSLAIKYSPDYVNFYILDFSSGMLSAFEEMPHTGGVLRENDTDRISKFFNMISSVIDERKKLFKGGNYKQYIKVNGVTLPSIIIVIDNFAGFKERTENAYENILIHLAREGVGYGIYFILSSAGFGIAEIQNRIGDNIRSVVSLEMGDKFKYMDVLRVSRIDVVPESGIKGRGVTCVEGRILEFQTALAVEADDDYKRNTIIEKVCRKMSETWTGKTARPVPYIPENPVFSEFKVLDEYKKYEESRDCLPIAYNFEDASVYKVDLHNVYCFSVSGKKRTGKTNLLKVLMYAVAGKGGDVAVIEKKKNELRVISNDIGAKYICDDTEIFDYFSSITDTFISRNKRKHLCEEKGMSQKDIYEAQCSEKPVFIFISDIVSFIDGVYHPQGNISNMSGFFENIFEKGYLHNIYFFAEINTDNLSTVSGSRVYQLFTSYKTGVHIGGNVASQRIFNFQNIGYSQMSKTSKKGYGLVPSENDETIAESIVIPLVGGFS